MVADAEAGVGARFQVDTDCCFPWLSGEPQTPAVEATGFMLARLRHSTIFTPLISSHSASDSSATRQ